MIALLLILSMLGAYDADITSDATTVTINSDYLDVSGCETTGLNTPKIGVFAFLTAKDTTTVTTGGTYYAIEGTFTNSPLENFTAIAGPPPGIRYDGAVTQQFEVDWHAAISGDSNGMTVHIGNAKNGTSPEACSIMGTYLKTANEEQALAGTCVMSLATNDVVTLVTTADDNGDLVIFHHYTTSIRPFFTY